MGRRFFPVSLRICLFRFSPHDLKSDQNSKDHRALIGSQGVSCAARFYRVPEIPCPKHYVEVATMKVFTSIFVLDSVRTTFDDLELSVRLEHEHPEALESTDGHRRRFVELQTEIGQRFNRQERDKA